MSDILVQKLTNNNLIVLYTAGAGAQALCHFTLHPGSSKYALESSSFYARGSLEMLLNRNYIEKFVSQDIAEDMALKALIRSHEILTKEQNVDKYNSALGIGITAAIRSVNDRQGRHHAFICFNYGIIKYTFYLDLVKDVRTREEEDQFISDIVFQLIIKYSTLQPQQNEDQFQSEIIENLQNAKLILINKESMNVNLINSLKNSSNLLQSIIINTNQYQLNPMIQDAIILSGSFNPIHPGHIELAQKAKQILNFQNIYFELSIKNADKNNITNQDIENRIEIMKQQNINLILSNKEFFKDKNNFLKNGAFAMGIDTYKRFIDCKYYNNSIQERDLSLFFFIQNNNKIVVAPRYNEIKQIFETLDDYEIPKILEGSVIELKEFRNDISSTKIRQSEAK